MSFIPSNLKKIIFCLLSLNITGAVCHGLIQSPASREQFCGVESKPDEIFRDKMTHEECRPIMTKADGSLNNSVYNFMGVLSHTVGRQGRTTANLPLHVCGFDSEGWGGGATPWDTAMNWPYTKITAGPVDFVWNISWGNHFSDTDEFVYWITKSTFVFDKAKELRWDDFEQTPFCLLKYDDTRPTANPNIIPNKTNNTFTTHCTVPARSGRAVIYAEWGRNYYTFERFHSCVDVVFSDGSSSGDTLKANIADLPTTVTGSGEFILDGSGSTGTNLSYLWTISAQNSSPYLVVDADKSKAKLVFKDIQTKQDIQITLTVSSNGFTNKTMKIISHYPATATTWKWIGDTLHENNPNAGDTVSLRAVDNNGKDYYLPASPIALDSESAKPENWSYVLANAINNNNPYNLRIGVLNSDTGSIEPVHSSTANKIYTQGDQIAHAYVVINSSSGTQSCSVVKMSGASPYWMGYNVFASTTPIVLDFTATGINLSKVVIDNGVFSNVVKVSDVSLIINNKPNWVSLTNPGYIGFLATNYNPLANTLVASCHAG